MKKKLALIWILIPLAMLSHAQEIIKSKTTVDIDILTFKGISQVQSNLNNKKQPLTTKDDIKEFLNSINTKYPGDSQILTRH